MIIPVIVGSICFIILTLEFVAVYRMDKSSYDACWDSGYHAFMVFSGYLVGLPAIGLFLSIVELVRICKKL